MLVGLDNTDLEKCCIIAFHWRLVEEASMNWDVEDHASMRAFLSRLADRDAVLLGDFLVEEPHIWAPGRHEDRLDHFPASAARVVISRGQDVLDGIETEVEALDLLLLPTESKLLYRWAAFLAGTDNALTVRGAERTVH